MSPRARTHAFVLVIVAIANLAVEVLHGLVLVPARARPEGVPPWQWVALFMPLLVGVVVASRRLRDTKDVGIASISSTATVLFEKWAIAAIGLFGQDPRELTTLAGQAPRIAFGFAVLFALAFVGFGRARDQRT